jgi:hypothetical protein
MLKNIGILLILGAASLALSADSCVLSSKSVQVPLRGTADLDFVSLGTAYAATDGIDFCQELNDLDSGSIDSLVSVSVENIYWRLVENRGAPNTLVTVHVDVQRGNGPSVLLVPDTTFVLSDVDTVFVPAKLNPAGLQLLLQGMDDYLTYWDNGKTGPCPSLDYTFTWATSASPAADFTWQVRVKFTMVGVFQVDVPDLWD